MGVVVAVGYWWIVWCVVVCCGVVCMVVDVGVCLSWTELPVRRCLADVRVLDEAGFEKVLDVYSLV